MTFGEALEAIKAGATVRRPQWKGGEVAYLNPGSISDEELKGKSRISHALKKQLFEAAGADTITRLPNLNLKTSDGATQTGWTPSQIDMFAEDWEQS